jgi:hypothetical protein
MRVQRRLDEDAGRGLSLEAIDYTDRIEEMRD